MLIALTGDLLLDMKTNLLGNLRLALLTTLCLGITSICFGQAMVQFIHNGSIAGVDTVDIWYGANKVAANLTYRSATDFVTVPASTPLTVNITSPNSTDPSNPLFSIAGTEFPTNGHYHYIAYGDSPLNVTIAIINAAKPTQPRDTVLSYGFNGLVTNNLWSLRYSRGTRRLHQGVGGASMGTFNYIDTVAGRIGLDVLERLGNNTFTNFSGSFPDSLIKAGKSCFVLLSGATANTPPYEKKAFVIPALGGRFISLSGVVTKSTRPSISSNTLVTPNPVQLHTMLNVDQGDLLDVSLISANGQVTSLPYEAVGKGQVRLDLNLVPAGLYSLRACTKAATFMTKLVVQ